MAFSSDHDPTYYRASCWACGSLGNYTSQRDANNAELQHQLQKHPVQLQGPVGSKATTKGKSDKQKLTRDQKRNKFPKPGKK